MRFIRTLALVLAFGAATSCATTQQADIGPNPPNVLDAYVAKPDPTFAWKVEKTFTGAGYHGAVLELTSQTWMTAADSRPPGLETLGSPSPSPIRSPRRKPSFYIDGGTNTSAAPTQELLRPLRRHGDRHRLGDRRAQQRPEPAASGSPRRLTRRAAKTT